MRSLTIIILQINKLKLKDRKQLAYTNKWLSQDSNFKLKTNDLFLRIKMNNGLYTH